MPIPLRVPENESDRIAAVRRYSVLDTPPDGAFDQVVALAASMFDVPIALVTIVDEDRIWFKARHGLDEVNEIPREPGLCASAICQDEPYIIEHARNDPRSFANPLVAGEFGLQFYAAAQLRMQDGFNLGTLCLLDREPRTFSAGDREKLQRLAAIVVDELELRLQTIRAIAQESQLRQRSTEVAFKTELLYERERKVTSMLQEAMLPRSLPQAPDVTFDSVYIPASSEAVVGGDWYDAFALDERRILVSVGDVTGHGIEAATLMGKLRQSLRAIALSNPQSSDIIRLLDQTLKLEDDDRVVTAVVAIVDMGKCTVEYTSAGHPPPLMRSADGTIVELSRTGLPLGLRGRDEPGSETVTIASGSMLVLYTDGLIEHSRDIIVGERALHDVLARLQRTDDAMAAHTIKDALICGPTPDDVAILTLAFA